MEIARGFLWLAAGYLAVGVLFASVFLARWAGRIDPGANGSPVTFRMIVAPGVVALWPVLGRRVLRGLSHPPDRYTAHDRAAERRR